METEVIEQQQTQVEQPQGDEKVTATWGTSSFGASSNETPIVEQQEAVAYGSGGAGADLIGTPLQPGVQGVVVVEW